MGKMRPREDESLLQGHTASKQQSPDSFSGNLLYQPLNHYCTPLSTKVAISWMVTPQHPHREKGSPRIETALRGAMISLKK
jgi:hypothetical protein